MNSASQVKLRSATSIVKRVLAHKDLRPYHKLLIEKDYNVSIGRRGPDRHRSAQVEVNFKTHKLVFYIDSDRNPGASSALVVVAMTHSDRVLTT